MENCDYHNCLEVGCGRGSISSYFADNGFSCTLLDSSADVLQTAMKIFTGNGHHANFVHADALDMPFETSSFDVVVSIGLLEHFENIDVLLAEQYRVLRPGGLFLGYVVPDNPRSIQRYFHGINAVLAFVANLFQRKQASKVFPKVPVFRSTYDSARYLSELTALSLHDLRTMGVYPLPMISHSAEFPFSLLPTGLERALVCIFKLTLWIRQIALKRNPWICKETLGQAFLITFKKD